MYPFDLKSSLWGEPQLWQPGRGHLGVGHQPGLTWAASLGQDRHPVLPKPSGLTGTVPLSMAAKKQGTWRKHPNSPLCQQVTALSWRLEAS